jgi:hypothetical protein
LQILLIRKTCLHTETFDSSSSAGEPRRYVFEPLATR